LLSNLSSQSANFIMPRAKQSGHGGNRKRINSDGRPIPIRLKRSRKPETLQRFWQSRLQPWLDFANLLSFVGSGEDFQPFRKDGAEQEGERLREEFTAQFASRPISKDFPPALWGLANGVSRKRRLGEMLSIFKDIRGLLEKIPAMAWPSEEK